MEGGSIVTESMRERIGREINIQVMKIDQRMIDQYLDATGDAGAIRCDRAAAMKAGYADIPVPPGLLTTMQMEGDSPGFHMPEQAHLGGAVDAGGEWEFHHPVYLGDVVIVTRKLLGIREHCGKLGPSVINTFEVTYRNQRSAVVAKGTWTTFRYSTRG